MTWTCHICKKERDDEDIEVLTYPMKNIPNAERNVRYCSDNPDCFSSAQEMREKGSV